MNDYSNYQGDETMLAPGSYNIDKSSVVRNNNVGFGFKSKIRRTLDLIKNSDNPPPGYYDVNNQTIDNEIKQNLLKNKSPENVGFIRGEERFSYYKNFDEKNNKKFDEIEESNKNIERLKQSKRIWFII